jgi:tubulin polyglutamylase TTLL6/13
MVTSIDPWRIYIYNEGLARFAVEIYDPVVNKEKLCAHLTNFSLNKKNEKFVNN